MYLCSRACACVLYCVCVFTNLCVSTHERARACVHACVCVSVGGGEGAYFQIDVHQIHCLVPFLLVAFNITTSTWVCASMGGPQNSVLLAPSNQAEKGTLTKTNPATRKNHAGGCAMEEATPGRKKNISCGIGFNVITEARACSAMHVAPGVL